MRPLVDIAVAAGWERLIARINELGATDDISAPFKLVGEKNGEEILYLDVVGDNDSPFLRKHHLPEFKPELLPLKLKITDSAEHVNEPLEVTLQAPLTDT